MSAFLLTSFAKEKPGIIMTVNGEDIPTSEFEYLYLKNLRQQTEPQTIDDYIGLFKTYRLKVAEAKAHGKDTTEAFKKEIEQYRKELMEPYLVDSVLIYNYVDIAARREKEEVEANHIMLLKSQNPEKDKTKKLLLDSLREELKNGALFNEIAKNYSEDKSAQKNEGYLGYIVAGRFPYSFETAVYETPEGIISDIVESPVGYHIVKSGARRPSRGKIEGAHIMRMVGPNASEEQEIRQKEIIDSLYNILKINPDMFGDLAISFSDDKGSGKKGGLLPIFGTGEMVPEFESVAFSLSEGEISEPIRTAYGWHIIKKIASHPQRDITAVKEEVIKRVANPMDPRFSELQKDKFRRLHKKHGEDLSDEEVIIAEEKWQYENNDEYRNLINEYTDGSMLYEISLDNVWNKAMNDTEGLKQYFDKHKAKYKWNSPKAKGILVQVKNDSIGLKVREQCESLSPDSIVPYIKTNFAKEAVAEKFLSSKGENAMIDNILFNGPKTKTRIKGFDEYFILQGRILDQPEEMSDVRANVTSDYQEELENQWTKELQKKYKVEINKKELERIRDRISLK